MTTLTDDLEIVGVLSETNPKEWIGAALKFVETHQDEIVQLNEDSKILARILVRLESLKREWTSNDQTQDHEFSASYAADELQGILNEAKK